MSKSQLLMVIFGFIFITYSCDNDKPSIDNIESEKKSTDSSYFIEDDFQPIISMDSLNRIEEELDEKLKEFEGR